MFEGRLTGMSRGVNVPRERVSISTAFRLYPALVGQAVHIASADCNRSKLKKFSPRACRLWGDSRVIELMSRCCHHARMPTGVMRVTLGLNHEDVWRGLSGGIEE